MIKKHNNSLMKLLDRYIYIRNFFYKLPFLKPLLNLVCKFFLIFERHRMDKANAKAYYYKP